MQYEVITPERIVKYGPKTIQLEDGTKLRMNKDARLDDNYIYGNAITTAHIVFGFNQNTDTTYKVTRTVDLTTLEILCIMVSRVEFI